MSGIPLTGRLLEDPEDTDPHYRQRPTIDDRVTQLSGPATLVLSDHAVLGHLAHVGDMLTEIRDDTRQARSALVTFLETATTWVRALAIVAVVAVVLGTLSGLLVFLTFLLTL